MASCAYYILSQKLFLRGAGTDALILKQLHFRRDCLKTVLCSLQGVSKNYMHFCCFDHMLSKMKEDWQTHSVNYSV